MNEIVNKFLLAGDKCMPEMHLREPGFACEPFTKSKKRIQKFKETGDAQYIYQNGLDKASFQQGMAYGDFKDLARRTGSNKILQDKAFNVAENSKYDGYQRGFALMVYTFFDKKISCSSIKNEYMSDQKLAGKLHKPSFRKFKKRKKTVASYRKYLERWSCWFAINMYI